MKQKLELIHLYKKKQQQLIVTQKILLTGKGHGLKVVLTLEKQWFWYGQLACLLQVELSPILALVFYAVTTQVSVLSINHWVS